MMELSGNIKKLRAENKLTQAQLAKKLNVSRSTISSWETGRSFPDLEMVIEICDCFNLSLDSLLREDEKMVKKLNFGIKQKRLLIALLVIVGILLLNGFMSTLAITATPQNLKISQVQLTRDHYYNGQNPDRDWNTMVHLKMASKNPFLKPKVDELIVFEEEGNLIADTTYTFNLFNIFDSNKTVEGIQSVFINQEVRNDEISLKVKGDSKGTIAVRVVNVNE
ncbi:helix-turn-helix transcriptional regulator [Vagococcus zengguangii]|uniref:Helix-turn-helix transcriptional regulator n=1 Tax=Vagococcus zengguangii TaxID=2571750 RepID=A0A4D7D0H8_9ENTE|nr:helix-turn-helix transcriptional regulator [Vagococcus zengguangii]QCI87226.1 helix-turn-helix transcriptional regulator [Vagococcus zengguangii]TLG80730.1 helix-turn-helix transcriptional regulator [Vagococcus zengguangii]